MSETESLPVASGDRAGALLREARERAGLHIVNLAAMLKVPVQRLEALERGHYHALPDATFARALALSVCRVLKTDPTPVLAAMPAGPAPALQPSSGSIDAPMPREGGAPGFSSSEPTFRRSSVWVALGLVLLAVVLWYALPADGPEPTPSSTPEVSVPTSAAPPSSPPATTAAPATGLATPPAGTDTAAVVTPGPSANPVMAAPAGAAAAPSAVPTASTTPSESSAPSVLQLRVQATSWIQVTGASGRVLLQRSVQPGERVTVDEDLPLSVTVGRADATEVTVRGQPFDLVPLTRNNVARFEIR